MPEDKNKTPAAAADQDHFDHVERDHADTDPGVEGESMDQLVSAIKAQIAVADERHSDVLTDMQHRLGSLGGDVDEIRQRIPENLTGDLHRIESGLETLSERVARMATSGHESDAAGQDEVDEEPIQASDVSQEDDFSVATDSEDDLAFRHDAQSDETDDAIEAATDAPAALKSATATSPIDEFSNDEPKPNHTHGVDTFDMVDTSVAGDPGSPWDQDSAEALTKLYEQTPDTDSSEEAPLMPTRTPDPESQPLDAFSEPAADGLESPAAPAMEVGIDREWLDRKFSDIAERIEQTLAELNPERTSFEVGERIQDFEARVGSALEDVATRADIGGLREIESHVTGMAAQMTQTETQLSRLDSIENQLQDVITQFSQGGGVGFATGDGMPAAGIDADALADTAAARIVDHLSATGQGTGSEAGIEDVRNLIEGFLNEHREGNEQTALMLDTIQQAMIRILDRLDVLEAGGVPAAEPHYEVDAAAEPVPHSQDEMEMASQGWVEPEGSLPASDDDVVLTEEHAGYAQPAEEEAVVEIHGRDEAAAVGDHAGVETAPMQSGDESAVNLPQAEDLAGSQVPQADPQVQQPQPEASSGYASPDLLSDRSAAADVPAEPQAASRETIDKIRHNFIADAQQAKAKAAHAAAAAAATGEQPKKGSARRSVLAGMKSPSTDVESTGGMFGSKTRRLLVGALLAVIVINGALFLLPRDEAPAAIEAPAATSEPVDKQTQKTKTPSLDQSSLMTTDDGFAPPVKTNVVMDDLRQAVLDAEHRAAGSADLPFGLVLQQTTAGAWTKAGRDLAQVMPASLKPADAVALPGSRTYAAPSTKETASRSKLPPLTVGPSSLRMAAANGDASAQFEVGTRLSEGKGTKQDFKQAATWFKRSAGQGFAQAQYRLGTLYERGLGLTRDVNRAQAWYLRAAEQGNIRAMHNLAVLSAGQSSGKPDYARAAQWFIKAAESGLADSQFNAGVLFENGLGVSQDLIQAYKWYTLAARTGDKESLKRSQKIRSKLAIDVLGEAETAVRSFAPAKVDPLVNNARLAGQDWKSRHNG